MFTRRVVGESMSPALRPGGIVIAVRPRRPVRVNDIVIVAHEGLEKVKRVAEIDEDRLFVLGDNLDASTDSRNFGWLTTSVVLGKVVWPKADRPKPRTTD